MDQKLVDRYIKIKRLAEEGQGGEQTNAARHLAELENQHPGLKEEALRQIAVANGESQQGQGNADWDTLLRYARGAYQEVQGFVEALANAGVGTLLAEEVTSDTRVGKAGNLIVSLRINYSTYLRSREMNAVQQQAFRQRLHELIDKQLDRVMGEG